MIKAVLYDLGDIFFEAHYWREWIWQKLSSRGYFNGSFKEFYYLYEESLLPVCKGEKGYKDNYIDFLKFLGVENPLKFQKQSFKKKKYFEDRRKLYPGVYETLKRLKERNIQNVVITDNEASEQEVRINVIERFKINHLLDYVFTSKDIGVTKPNPLIFRNALDKLNLKTNEVIFVGHDKDEIDGAKKFGLKVVQYNNYLKIRTKADYKISEFSELLNFF